MSPHIQRFGRVHPAVIGVPLLICLLTAAFLSVSAAGDQPGNPADDAHFQRSLEDGRSFKFKPTPLAAPEGGQEQACLEYGHYSDDFPKTLNPLNHGCQPVNRGDANTPDWAIKDDLNPYSSAEEELAAYQQLVDMALKGQDITEGSVHKKHLVRAGGAKNLDAITMDKDHKPWGDFIDLVIEEDGRPGQLTLITARANLHPDDSSKADVQTRFFLVGTQGHLDMVSKSAYWYERLNLGQNPEYHWYYHQLLRSWLQPQPDSPPKQTP